jgi:hypothetical protein
VLLSTLSFQVHHNPAVTYLNDAVCLLGDAPVVSDNYKRCPELFVDIAESSVNSFGIFRIQVSAGLIGQYQFRFVHKCPNNGCPLLLTSGHSGGRIILHLGNAHQFKEVVRAFQDGVRDAGLLYPVGHKDILEGGELRQQEMELENESDDSVPQLGDFIFGHHVDPVAIDDDFAPGRSIQRPDDIQKGGLAAAGLPYDRVERTSLEAEIYIEQHLQINPVGVDLIDVLQFDDVVHLSLADYLDWVKPQRTLGGNQRCDDCSCHSDNPGDGDKFIVDIEVNQGLAAGLRSAKGKTVQQ